MNCQNLEQIILEMARAQLLEASVRRQALAHIAQCEICADRLAEQQELTATIRATAKSLRHEGASSQVEQSLQAAFRKQTAATSTVRYLPTQARPWSRLVLAAAAILLLALLAGGIRRWQTADPQPTTATVEPTKPTKPTKKDVPEELLPTFPNQESARHSSNERNQKRRPVQRDTTSNEEITTRFFALADESELVPLESGQVLRVELSASKLISMGLPITTEDVSKPVLADLLIGQDGLARAIRFVQSTEVAPVGALQSTNK